MELGKNRKVKAEDIQPVVEAVEVTEVIISDEVADVVSPVEAVVKSDTEIVEPIVHPRKTSKKIVLHIGPSGIADLRIPFGYNTLWKEDKVVTQRVAANTQLEVAIPEECDLQRWVRYYKQLAVLGINIVKFGTFEEV